MKSLLAWTVAGAMASLATGCLFEASPDAKAAHIERLQCGDVKTPKDEVQFIQALHVLYVDAEYGTHEMGIGTVQATRIVIRPPEGITTERVSRVLQCHGARAYLHHEDQALLAHDPYFLPDGWVAIDVKSEEGNYVAVLSSDTVHNNLRIQRNAKAFAAAQRAAAPAPHSGL